MKKITIVIIAILFTFTGIAQEKINWLTLDQFEKEIKKEKKDYFILIDDNRINDKMSEEMLNKRNKQAFSYLDDVDLINYLNKNFICFRFNPNTETISFNGISYKKEEKNNQVKHEFITFLTSQERDRLPAIVLRDKKFKLFKYKKFVPNIEELAILLEAEKVKNNYISEKLDKDNPAARRSAKMLENQQKKLEEAQEDTNNPSVLFAYGQRSDRLLKMLIYFSTGANNKIDFKSYLNNK